MLLNFNFGEICWLGGLELSEPIQPNTYFDGCEQKGPFWPFLCPSFRSLDRSWVMTFVDFTCYYYTYSYPAKIGIPQNPVIETANFRLYFPRRGFYTWRDRTATSTFQVVAVTLYEI